jgi:hypothetical protein
MIARWAKSTLDRVARRRVGMRLDQPFPRRARPPRGGAPPGLGADAPARGPGAGHHAIVHQPGLQSPPRARAPQSGIPVGTGPGLARDTLNGGFPTSRRYEPAAVSLLATSRRHGQDCTKARRSALIVSASVVGEPCGNPA